MANAPSGFNEFTSDYDKVNHIDNPTYEKRKIYTKDFWLVHPNKNFSIRLGETKPDFQVFLKTAGEQFGDPITPLNVANYTAVVKCYDGNGKLVVRDTATLSNASLGEFIYSFKTLDFPKKGRYFAEVEFKEGNNVFTLPASNSRIEIIVN